jgi:hypothetical protein
LLTESPTGPTSLAALVADGRRDLVVAAVENLLGQRASAEAWLDPTALADAVLPYGDLIVDLPEGGNATVPPSGLSSVLEADAASGLARLVRSQTVWSAWLAAMTAAPGTAPAPSLGGVGAVMASLSKGEVGQDVLPVEAIPGADGSQEYRPRADDLDGLLVRLLPAAPRYRERPTVRVVDAADGQAPLPAAVRAVVDGGGRVTLFGEAPAQDDVVVRVHDERRQAVARAIAAAVAGRSEAAGGGQPTDLTLVVGRAASSGRLGSTSTTQGAPS